MARNSKVDADSTDETAVQIFARNVQLLVQERQRLTPGATKAKIAGQLGFSLRSLANARKGAHRARMDALDKVATAFKLSPWQLLLPDLPAAVLFDPELRRSMQLLIESDPEDRKAVERLLSKKQKTA